MNKGDKFIVVDNKHIIYQLGEEVKYTGESNSKYHWVVNNYLVKELVHISQIKPLDRFPCDDEQPNN